MNWTTFWKSRSWNDLKKLVRAFTKELKTVEIQKRVNKLLVDIQKYLFKFFT